MRTILYSLLIFEARRRHNLTEVSRRSRDPPRTIVPKVNASAAARFYSDDVARGRKRAILSRVLSSAIPPRSFPSINVLETNTLNLRRVAGTSPPFQERTGSRIPHRNRRCNYQTCIKTRAATRTRVRARSTAINHRGFSRVICSDFYILCISKTFTKIWTILGSLHITIQLPLQK